MPTMTIGASGLERGNRGCDGKLIHQPGDIRLAVARQPEGGNYGNYGNHKRIVVMHPEHPGNLLTISLISYPARPICAKMEGKESFFDWKAQNGLNRSAYIDHARALRWATGWWVPDHADNPEPGTRRRATGSWAGCSRDWDRDKPSSGA